MKDYLFNKKIDPADTKQTFSDIQLKVHCCRYWMLEEWECVNMAFPFWRLYYNIHGEARVSYDGKIFTLTPDKIFVIPPDTSFSTRLKENFNQPLKERIIGKRIECETDLILLKEKKFADHLFIHFNLGLVPDNVSPGIYLFDINDYTLSLITKIKRKIITDNMQIDLSGTFAIHSLILYLLNKMPGDCWNRKVFDRRIMFILHYIEKNYGERLTNQKLASKVNLATNSLIRLFHENTHNPLQEYIRKKRIEKACLLMHHTSDSIEQIAVNCGFVDRHHFSRVFKQITNVTPAYYKKYHTLEHYIIVKNE